MLFRRKYITICILAAAAALAVVVFTSPSAATKGKGGCWHDRCLPASERSDLGGGGYIPV